jgi:E3 ubiquitin-protein ligase DOA10
MGTLWIFKALLRLFGVISQFGFLILYVIGSVFLFFFKKLNRAIKRIILRKNTSAQLKEADGAKPRRRKTG